MDSEIVACGTKDLLTDPLGSLVKEISSGASMGSLIEMYPYGSLVGGTGSPTIPFVYIAAYGYYKDDEARDYVRGRELYMRLGRWMQNDPLWPSESSFGYVGGSPVVATDPSGVEPVLRKTGCAIYVCEHGGISWHHRYVCVEGPGNGCSGGSHPNSDPDDKYGGKPGDCNKKKPRGYTCTLESRDCDQAAKACQCIKKLRTTGVWEWVGAGFCWGFVGAVLTCATGPREFTCSNDIYAGLPEVGPCDPHVPIGYKKWTTGGWRAN